MCDRCHAGAMAVIDVMHRIRARHADWTEVVAQAASEHDVDRLVAMAVGGPVVLTTVVGQLLRTYPAAPLAEKLDPDICALQVLDRAAAHARYIRHCDADADWRLP
jgi:hypothetical protein